MTFGNHEVQLKFSHKKDSFISTYDLISAAMENEIIEM